MEKEIKVCVCPDCNEPGDMVKKILEMHAKKVSTLEALLTLAAAIDTLTAQVKAEVKQMLDGYTTPDDSVTHEMLKARSVDTENMVDHSVTLDKLSVEGVIEYLVRETKKRIEDEMHDGN